MRTDRLLTILLLLQTHGRQTARELAARLEVSERTVERDMESLSMAGVPVYALRGRRGGWELSDGYRTDLTGLTEPELRGLLVAAAPGVLADLGLGEAAERAVTKVFATLPQARRLAVQRARSYIHVDPSGWRRQDEAAPHLGRLEEALRLGVRIRVRYERASDGSTVDRELDPLGLVAKGSTWYLVATTGGEPRTYRASRVRDVEPLDEPAARPDDFDLATFWAGSREAFVAVLPRFDGTIRVAPDALPRIRGGWRYSRVEDESAPDADGWIRLRMRWDTIDVAVDYVLGLGRLAEVVEPDELRDRVLAEALAISSRAAPPGP